MIHQVSGFSFGTLKDMEETVAEVSRVNSMLFKVIKDKTKINDDQLNEVIKNKKDWFISADEALQLGILTEIIA